MMKVYKYFLRSNGVNRDLHPYDDIKMPRGAKILSAVCIDNLGYIYAAVRENLPHDTTHRIHVIGTGKSVPEGHGFGHFVGTIHDGAFVWHIFDGGEISK